MKLNYESDDEGLNRLLEPLNGYYEWTPEDVMEYLIFIDDIDFDVADDMLRSPKTYIE